MEISLDAANSEALVLYVAGDIDVSVTEALADAGRAAVLGASEGTTLIIDIEKVEFVDSTGLGALLSVLNFANEHAVGMALRSVSTNLSQLLAVTGLDSVFSTY